jgi:GNAT superfamily N-acetyltransferase
MADSAVIWAVAFCSIWHRDVMDEHVAGALNLGRFVSATAGRTGTTQLLSGGVAVASPVPVVNGFVNAAVPLPGATSDFVGEAMSFFAGRDRGFVMWVPGRQRELTAIVQAVDSASEKSLSPAMSVRQPIAHDSDLEFRVVATGDDGVMFGDVAERGYELAGLAWLLARHDSFGADGSIWVTAFDGQTPVGTACGYLDGDTGGIYYVATPPEHRGRGVAAACTAWVTNWLLEHGANCVTLQASQSGFPVYQRLGFTVYDTYRQFEFAAPPAGDSASL